MSTSIHHEVRGFGKVYTLSSPPPRLYEWNRKSTKQRERVARVFEPYPENLPLEAGFYAFVLDDRARFRVERGMVSSHAAMVRREPVGAAGFFRITRVGKVGEVSCRSLDYALWADSPGHPLVRFVIDAFRSHQAFDVSPHAYFQFSKAKFETFYVAGDGVLLEDVIERQRAIEAEGQGEEGGSPFPPERIAAFSTYVPPLPSRLYAMKRDQLFDAIDFDDQELFEIGDFKPAYSPADGRLSSGRKAFVVDPDGRLIIGHGHHLLAGGREVASAGQIHVDEDGVVTTINLNFSGHYRPPLSAEYARYTYSLLIGHPLLAFSPDCRINARRQFDLDGPLERIEFTPEELLAADGRLEAWFEDFGDEWRPLEDEEPTD